MTAGEGSFLAGMILMLVGGCCICLNDFLVMSIFVVGILLMLFAAFRNSEA